MVGLQAIRNCPMGADIRVQTAGNDSRTPASVLGDLGGPEIRLLQSGSPVYENHLVNMQLQFHYIN